MPVFEREGWSVAVGTEGFTVEDVAMERSFGTLTRDELEALHATIGAALEASSTDRRPE